jgi:hypothetical protein
MTLLDTPNVAWSDSSSPNFGVNYRHWMYHNEAVL